MLSIIRLSCVLLLLGTASTALSAGRFLNELDPVKAVVFEDDFESFSGQATLNRWQGVSPA